MSAYTDKVRPHTLRSGLSALGSVVGALKKAHIYALCSYLKKSKIELCHKLLLVLGVGLVQTRSYSERWQVARIGLCDRGAVCGTLNILNCPLA